MFELNLQWICFLTFPTFFVYEETYRLFEVLDCFLMKAKIASKPSITANSISDPSPSTISRIMPIEQYFCTNYDFNPEIAKTK